MNVSKRVPYTKTKLREMERQKTAAKAALKTRQIRINTVLLHKALGKRGMTKAELSRVGPFAYNTVMNLFRGSVKWIRIDTMERMCQLLQIKPGDFFEYGEPEAR